MRGILGRTWDTDDAQDIAEYALMLAVILVIVISVVTVVGTNASTMFSKVADKLKLN